MTALGGDQLLLLRMDGREEISGPFEWRVEALSLQDHIDLNALLGTHATVEIDHAQGRRAFDGIVCEARSRGAFENGFRYDLVLRPWLHVASLRRNMRIFHNKTVIEIVEEVLGTYGAMGNPHLEILTSGDYPILEYTVQYGESDADFIRRQLERHGISRSWKHALGSHTLVLSDAAVQLPEVPGGARAFYGVEGFHRHEEEHFHKWSTAARITTGAVRLTEYNFKIPHATQEVDQLGEAVHPQGDVESYDWPGDYLTEDEGRHVVTRRLDEERGQAPRHEAVGDVVSLGAGWRVTLAGDPVSGATGQCFVCLRAEHQFRAQGYGSGDAGGDETPYEGAYVLMPDSAPYRPERRTAAPRVQGPETAVVVGEGEIDCDEHGRILVRYHWDLDGAHSMRVRVSQNWASKGWGGMVIPRIGMEVIVEHLRGDPDKPIVTGCVYNGHNTPPYDLPEHKTKSTFRSDSHKSEGFNELTFEDATGAEKIYLHAEKDQEIHVENNRAKRIDRNQSESVGHNKSIEVGNNHHEVIGGNMTLMVGPNKLQAAVTSAFKKFTSAIGDMTSKLGLPDALNMGEGNLIIGVAKNKAETVMLSSTEMVGAAKALTVGGGLQVTVGGVKNESVAIGSWEEVGNNKVTHVGEKYEIVVGKSKITLDHDGNISLDGVNITVNGSSAVKVTGGRIDLN
ncbi:type VI secretion system tip protein VgrG [Epibacterium sp. SM1979]|uniref:Type VI secretion system tip protein VgrG n=1 Tax=Tritonibacter litoralis TaxID=2662264 RepID=A0A843YLI8_9RHOB|nr:type VI secretion system tip protein TssI/VgrG [Tritonibacter litoralis]MQQ10284.1 type VI secretion system tip protein VgrG [Tritonibacter litoralis]